MAQESHDLASLIEATAGRDIRAFSLLYEQTWPVLRAAARRWVGRASLGEDILQITYTKIWEKADRYDRAGGGALAWMIRICRNVAIDELRRNRSMQANDECACLQYSEVAEADRDLLIDLRSSWARLPRDQADALAGVYLSGLSHGELAQRLRLPLGTLKSRIRRALNSLKDSLAEGVQ